MPVLQFKGKTAVETYHHSLPHHTLELDPSLSLLPEGASPSLDGNLIIEGDNLLALKALLPTHAGKVKCIYIDPPYNTGNEGWVYNDNLTQPQFKEWVGQVVGKEGEDACRHDKWCCMMLPRLHLLRELLSEDGAIFVSIDDNEHQHLRMLMDEIFLEHNFVATILWQKNFSPKNSAKWFSEDHEYIVVYARSKTVWRPILAERTEEQLRLYSNPDDDPRGPWTSGDLTARNPYSKGIYSVTCPGGRHIDGPPPGTYWRVEEPKLWQLHADNRVWWGEDGNGVPRLKRFLSDVKEGVTPRTVWLHSEAGNTQEAKKALNEVILLPESVFQTPKPPRLIEKILTIATAPGDLVLDSFAGSGTTGQAVLSLNKLDGGQRRFILVQQPYDTREHELGRLNLCRSLTAERVRRVSRGYSVPARDASPVEVPGLGGSFTYARVSDTPLLGDYRDLGQRPPSFEVLARYVFYTETSHEWDASAVDCATGRIGVHAGTSYYLLYEPNGVEDRALDLDFLSNVAATDPNSRLVVYCERLWLHRDELRRWEREHVKSVRSMAVPYDLK